MKAKLKVLSGGSAGKELKLKEGQFLIGRSDSCHLRPRSDAVSRKHCVLFVDEKGIRARDLKSRNGTLLNGEKIEGDVALKSGDQIVIGPLEFEIILPPVAAPQAEAPKEAAPPPVPAKAKSEAPAKEQTSPKKQPAKTAAGAGDSVDDDDIFGWLEEGDEVDREQRMADPSTRQFKVDEVTSTDTVDMAKPEGSDTSVGKKGKKEKKEKKEPGKLPPVPEKAAVDSQAAASEALKQFFKRS